MFNNNIVCLRMNSAAVKKDKLFETIKQALIKDIKDGNFPIGEKIPAEPELMSRFEVGRSTIREAIKSLTESGILTVRQGYGTIVNKISDTSMESRLRNSDFAEINQVRGILEKEIVGLAVINHTVDDINTIEHALADRLSAIEIGNIDACIDADIKFHMAIAMAAGNSVLTDLYENFTRIIRDFFSRREPNGVTKFAMSHYLHEQLAANIKEKNLEDAQLTIAKILNNNH